MGLIERNVVAQVAVHAPEVLRAEPPLIITEADIDRFVAALAGTLESHSAGVVASFAGALGRMVSTRISSVFGGSP